MAKDNKRFYIIACPYCYAKKGRACRWLNRQEKFKVLGTPHVGRKKLVLMVEEELSLAEVKEEKS